MVLREAFQAVVSTVASDASSKVETRQAYVDLVSALLAFVVSVLIISFVGKLLWNSVIFDLFTNVKPARSVWQILGLAIFVKLIIY
jgi:hypothetical protein